MTNPDPVLIKDILFQGQAVDGEVGIEVEVEGVNLPDHLNGKNNFWTVTRDGSLRGTEAYEYVLTNPILRTNVDEALSQLYTRFQKKGSVLDDSGRAGVHIHINIRDLTLKELYNFIFLYLVFDKILVDFCGENRVGNLFCLRAEDAEYILVRLRNIMRSHNLSDTRGDVIRYASLNLTAIAKYGSLEFRSLPSPVPQEVISVWTNLLLALKDKSRTYADPREIVLGVSEMGAEWFASQVFGDKIEHLKCDDWGKEVMSGIRRIQPVVNGFNDKNYEEFQGIMVKKMEERAKKLQQQEAISTGELHELVFIRHRDNLVLHARALLLAPEGDRLSGAFIPMQDATFLIPERTGDE